MPERLSPLHHRHQTAGAHLQANAVQHYGDPATEQTAIPHLALADLSPLPRSGHRGPTATTALTAQGWHPPATPNTAVPQSDGTLIAALSPTEHLLLSNWRKAPPPAPPRNHRQHLPPPPPPRLPRLAPPHRPPRPRDPRQALRNRPSSAHLPPGNRRPNPTRQNQRHHHPPRRRRHPPIPPVSRQHPTRIPLGHPT